MNVIKKETIIRVDHSPKEKKKRVKSKRGRAVKNVRNGRSKINFEQNAMVKTPKMKGIIFNEKNSFFENRSCGLDIEIRDSPACNLAEIKRLINEPPIK